MNAEQQKSSDSKFKQGKESWFTSLGARLSAYHFIFMLVLIFSTVAALFYIEQNVLLSQGHEQSRQLGNRIVAELGQRVASTEAITRNLAQLGELLDKDPQIFKKVIPEIIDFSGDSRIAGGGIWPEPFSFDPALKRRSFFWGRESDGSLKYFDDYNDMDGPGYHNEEWYVPARYLKAGKVYWSKSYMDPYSYEPMVTCTAPMFKNGKFSGVSTIDIKLTGLEEFFREKAANSGAYIFAVDRNNKLLSFPDKQSSKHFNKDENGKISEEFMNITELSAKLPSYKPVESLLNAINLEVFKKESEKSSLTELSRKISDGSYQINEDEGEIIAAYLNGLILESEQKIQLSKDPVLNKQSLIYTFVMPSTGWKVLVVTPLEKVNAFAKEVTSQIIKFVVVVELVILLLMLLVTSKLITKPLASMSQKLNEVSEDALDDILLQEQERSDEIGHLAYEINKRSKAIRDSINKLQESNLVLEERVKERTDEIQQALKQVEEAKTKAESANKSKSHFLANMSHEIRTPMNAILGYTDLLYKELHEPKLRNYIATIKNSGQSLLTLINDILDLSKVEAGKIELNLKPVNIRQTFESVIDQFRDIAEKKQIGMEFFSDDSIPPFLKLDDHRMRQILNNLVGNAVKFTRKGKVKISLISYSENGELKFSVKDEGPGIPEEKQEQIFENFEQADNVDTECGTGLGLAITKRLVELMNGNISVESSFGNGAEFFVELNGVKIAEVIKAEETPDESSKFHFQAAKILIADDIKENMDLLINYLEDQPFEIFKALNGREAVEICKKELPDLVLMDMKMPEVDGYAATKELKEAKSTSNIPVIAVTAAAMKESENEVRELCDGYLKKPVSESELIQEMALFLKVKISKKDTAPKHTSDKKVAKNLILVLDREFVNQIIEISERREIKELHALNEKLHKISSENPSHIFQEWTAKINEHLNNFDMEKVQNELNNVIDIVTEIENSLTEKVS